MNGFQELVNITTKGRWLDKLDFAELVAIVFQQCGMPKEWMIGENLVSVLVEMHLVGFSEFDSNNEFVRIKKEWYGEN
jgi:hypothetical protein